MGYSKEELFRMDIMNNYIMNLLATDKEISLPFCKMMIRELLHINVQDVKIIAERIVVPSDPSRRGIRMDISVEEYDGPESDKIARIYDIEPHRDKEKFFPKKARYSQAMIDSKYMKRGERNFNSLPTLYIIYITNYDPFGYDQMVYTIDNHCAEVPELCYNDGVKILFFNSKGTKGGSQSLKNFLVYLEDSVKQNAVDDATREADSYMDLIRNRKGDGMYTLGDWIDDIVSSAVSSAVTDKDAEIAKKDAELADKNAELEKINAELARLKNELADLKSGK